jgi:hypothetical protein
MVHIGVPGVINGTERRGVLSLSITPIANATSYEIRENGVLISTQTGLTYSGEITETSSYDYRGRFTNLYGDVEYSEYSTPIRVSYCYFEIISFV